MRQYRETIEHILENGKLKADRTGTGTLSTFGYQNRYDLEEGFPLLELKHTFVRGILEELKWFLDGDTNIKYLVDRNVGIWTPDMHRVYSNRMRAMGEEPMDIEDFEEKIKTDAVFASMNGDLGPVYGKQWRSWRTGKVQYHGEEDYPRAHNIDQIAQVIESIKNNPDSRRHIVSAWNVGDLDDMALPPCHTMFQFYVSEGKLSCQLYQRSADTFLGVPFNIASYAFLVHMVAKVTGLKVGEFIHTFGDLHLYTDHVELAKEMITRESRPLPQLVIKRDVKDINDFRVEDFEIVGYNPHPKMKAKVSVGG